MPTNASSSHAALMANWREPAEPAVLAGADPVLHSGVGAVPQLQQLQRARWPWGVGDEHLMPHALHGVEHRQLRPGVGPLAPHDHPRALRIRGEVDQVGEFGDLGPVAQLPVGVEGRDPVHARGDRGADGFSDRDTDGEERTHALAA
jgi:hypothetical protein